MNLHAKETFQFSIRGIIICYIAHEYPINKMLQPVTLDNQVNFIPIATFYMRLQRINTSQ